MKHSSPRLSLTNIVGLQYHYVCDTDLYARVIQTWTNSKSGVLSSVAVNLAAGNQSTNVQVTVFRFSNFSDLVSPEYVTPNASSSPFHVN